MKISVIHPSRGRPEQAYKTACNWHDKADNSYEYIISLDTSDIRIHTYFRMFDNFGVNRIIKAIGCEHDNKSAIEAINNAGKIASGDLIIVISDDFECPEHWDTLLLNELEGRSDFCAKTDDGLQPTLITMPIMDRIYYERYKYVYHPDFLHMHADEELTCVALMTGKYLKLLITFLHNHYTTGRIQKDEINDKNNSTWGQGQRTLDRHALNNFGVENPVMRREDIVWR